MSDFIIELPEGWIETSVGQLTEPSKEKIDPTSLQEERNYIGLEHIKSNAGSILGYGISSDVCSSKSIFKKGDLLYGKLRPYLNKVYLAEIDGICSTDIMVFPRSETILNQYAKYRFLSNDFVRYANANSTGVQHPRVKFESLAEFPILLPPLNEQRRIVSTIEQLTDRSHKARTALEDVPKLIEQFRQSVLAAAFRGDLTADWREKNPDIEPANLIVEQIETKNTKGKHKNKLEEVEILNESQLSTLPDSWCWGTPSIACSDIVDCPHATAEYIEKGKTLIRTSDFRFGYLDISNVKFVSDEIFDKRTKRLQPSALDILYSREGGIFGIACLVPSDLELCMGQRMMLLRANRQCYEPELLMWAMNSPQIFRQASKEVTGTASPHVNVCDIKEFSLPIPPLEEQREILSKINRAFRILHCISEEYLASSKEIEQLDRSILAKAFRGELVPQDPNDEPAAVLLEKIRAEREQTSTPKQRGKTTGKNSSKQLSIEGIE
jgi:type I restriction enzyme, S subunit